MRFMVSSLIAATLLLSSCATIHKTSDEDSPLTPRDAIWRAAQKAPDGLRGTFVMKVKAIGSQEGRIFINSEEDYRDQRCLTIVVPAPLVESFTARNGNLMNRPAFPGGSTS